MALAFFSRLPWVGIALFFYVFFPNTGKVGSPLFGGIALIILATTYRRYFTIILRDVSTQIVLIVLALLIIYSLLHNIVLASTSSDFELADLAFSARLFILLCEVIPITMLLACWFTAREYEIKHVVIFFVVLALVQGLLVMLTFVSPYMREMLTISTLDASYKELLKPTLGYRIFGFAENYTFSAALYLGMAAAFILLLYVEAYWSQTTAVLVIATLLFSALVNARIGIIPIIFAILVCNIAYRLRMRTVYLDFFIICLAFASIVFFRAFLLLTFGIIKA